MSAQKFRVNHPHIVHEIIEDEAILVNLENGSYYSARQVGAVIWDGIENEIPVASLTETIVNAYQGDETEMRASVSAFLQQLQDERLVLPVESSGENGTHALATLPHDKPKFVAPVLKKYTEMEDLLLLDPIHDVDDAGWPQRANESQTP